MSSFTAALAQEISLTEYRRLASEKDPSVKAAQAQSEGIIDAVKAYDVASDARVFIRATEVDDKRPTLNPSFQGTRTMGHLLSFGVSKQSEWGPQFSLSQNVQRMKIEDASSTAVPLPTFYDVYPEAHLTIPLWRNLFGAETRAEIAGSKTLNENRKLEAQIQAVQVNASVDLSFYTYAANKEMYEASKEMFDRAEKIYNWVKNQRARGLVEESDVYQARAAVQLRRLELNQIENQLKASARKFNDLRGIVSDEVKENLIVTPLDTAQLQLSKSNTKVRKDQKIAMGLTQMQMQEFTSAREKAKPNLDLTFKAQWVGRDREYNEANSEWQDREQPYYYAGVEFSLPLNVPKYMDIRSGLKKMEQGEQLKIASRTRDDKTEWQNFLDLGDTLQKQVALSRELEESERLKSKVARTSFQRGRSTTFQILTFEQDYITAQIQRIKIELQARQFLTQIPLFE